MLKNVVLGLVLANILLFAWKSWVLPPDAADPAGIEPAGGQRLVLISDEPVVADPVPPSPVSPGDGRCTQIGPFADVEMAGSVARQLRTEDFEVRRTSKAGEIWVGYWVQLVDLKTAEKAGETVDRLIGGGLPDAYIFQTEPTINISLGVFRSRTGATRVARLAQELGFRPEMTDRFQPGVEHWLTVKSRPEAALSLSDIRLGSTQILRTETVDCDAKPAVNARIQP